MTRHTWQRIGEDKFAHYDVCKRCELVKRTVVKVGAFNDRRVVRYAPRLAGPWKTTAGSCSGQKVGGS